MLSKLYTGMIFGAGVAVGAALAVFFVREKYRRRTQEEIDSVKEAFRRDKGVPVDAPVLVSKDDEPEEWPIYSVPPVRENAPSEEPTYLHVIPPDEYGDNDEYALYEWKFYADGVLADEMDEEVSRDEYEGIQIAEHFGEYEDDTVYLRDDDRECYYAILRDYRTFEEVLQTMPPDIRKLTPDSNED